MRLLKPVMDAYLLGYEHGWKDGFRKGLDIQTFISGFLMLTWGTEVNKILKEEEK